MLPLPDTLLRLERIAEFWSREHNRVRTSFEIYDELLSAFWKNDLIVYNGSGNSQVDRLGLLRVIRLCLEHPGFVIVGSTEEIPVLTTKHPDGSVSVDPTIYILLPLDESTWTSDILETVYKTLSTRPVRATAMKTCDRNVTIRRLDERRYAVEVDGIVRYAGSEEECQRRLAMLAPKKDRADQDKAVIRLGRMLR